MPHLLLHHMSTHHHQIPIHLLYHQKLHPMSANEIRLVTALPWNASFLCLEPQTKVQKSAKGMRIIRGASPEGNKSTMPILCCALAPRCAPSQHYLVVAVWVINVAGTELNLCIIIGSITTSTTNNHKQQQKYEIMPLSPARTSLKKQSHCRWKW